LKAASVDGLFSYQAKACDVAFWPISSIESILLLVRCDDAEATALAP
jgi:hypothetical protein